MHACHFATELPASRLTGLPPAVLAAAYGVFAALFFIPMCVCQVRAFVPVYSWQLLIGHTNGSISPQADLTGLALVL